MSRTTPRSRPPSTAAQLLTVIILAALTSDARAGSEPAAPAPLPPDPPEESAGAPGTPATCEVRWDCRDFPPPRCDEGDPVRYAGLCEGGLCRYVELRMRCPDGMVCRFGPRGPGCGTPRAEESPAEPPRAMQANPLGHLPTATRQLLLNASVRFGVGGTAIDRWDARLLDEVADALAAHPELRVRVDGHTDDTGRRAHNMRLSLDRAAAVRDALVARGVAPGRLAIAGLGPDQPLVANDNERNRSFNRRADIVVVGVAGR